MRRLLPILLATLAGAGLLPSAWGQVHQIQQGNVLDANPQMGSGGLNAGGRQYNINAGNRIVSGNVTGGAAFRGFSPIRDPSSLFLGTSSITGSSNNLGGLPSDRLSNFQRDAVSVTDVQRGRTVATGIQPYYSLQRTVTNTGSIIAGQNRPGTSQMQSPYMVPRTDWATTRLQNPLDGQSPSGNLLKVPTQIARIDNGQLIKGQVNERLLASPLFGAVRMVPSNELANQAERDRGLGAEPAGPLDQRVNRLEPLDTRVGGAARTSMERVLGPRTQEPNANQPGGPQPVDRRVGAAAMNKPPSPGNEQKGQRTAGAGESQDLFTTMRITSGQMLKPLEPPRTLAQEAKVEQNKLAPTPELIQPLKSPLPQPEKPQLAAPPPGVTVEERIKMAEKVSKEPLKTFVGTEESAINKYMGEAEQLLRSGQYYKAASQYDMARMLDANNPLPLLGRAVSLLAAGDYMSSSTNLFQAIRLFDSLANFPIDLTAFIPDVGAMDRRRADLERRLESVDDYHLRFLLGYAEYNSGLRKLGLTNMKRAADVVPLEWSAVRNFVTLLEQRQAGILPSSQPESGH